MSKEALTSLIEWLKPLAQNDSTRGVKYNPIRALWATVILSALVTDHAGHCNNIREELDVDYINSDCFREDLENVGCKIDADAVRKSILA